jgi:hypothetical protein
MTLYGDPANAYKERTLLSAALAVDFDVETGPEVGALEIVGLPRSSGIKILRLARSKTKAADKSVRPTRF